MELSVISQRMTVTVLLQQGRERKNGGGQDYWEINERTL
jgi:hypothetical protein